LPKRHAALRRLASWADRTSIFFEGCQKPVKWPNFLQFIEIF
jgi:hypothetical protein